MYIQIIISIIEGLLVVVPSLLTVAFVTIAERKTMASMQRRLGPNIVGYYGLLQAFADALKLLLKEYISPTQANLILFFIGPIITLIFALLGYGVIPYGPGLSILDLNLGILYLLAVSSLSTYGILLAGWSANSKYAFLGSLRSTAQLISYELILSSAILLAVLLTGNLNLSVNVETQKAIFMIVPLFPIFVIFFIGSIAETNRAPFDLAEAESELVSGFMTEHAAVIFVFFFLAEYASIILICILTCILFLGGYLSDLTILNLIFDAILYTFVVVKYIITSIHDVFYSILVLLCNFYKLDFISSSDSYIDFNLKSFVEDEVYSLNVYLSTNFYITHTPYYISHLIYSLNIGVKSCIMIFIFIWARASFPRIRFDQLMSFCWTVLLPIVIAFVIIIPCIIYSLDIIPSNVPLL